MQSFETGRGGDDAGAPYTVGAAVEIMSKSQGGWVAANVTTVDKAAAQITVQYKNAKGNVCVTARPNAHRIVVSSRRR